MKQKVTLSPPAEIGFRRLRSPGMAVSRGVGFLCVLVFCSTVALAQENSEKWGKEVAINQTFDSINVCSPITVLVRQAADKKSKLLLDGSKSFLKSVDVAVKDSELVFRINSSFLAEGVVKAVIEVAGNVSLVESDNAAEVVIQSGFTPKKLTLHTAGVSIIYMPAAKVDDLRASSTGSSWIIVRGTIDASDVVSLEASRIMLQGSRGPIEVTTAGASRVYADPKKESNVTITGRATGVSRVFHTNKEGCDVDRGVPIFKACTMLNKTELPAFNPKWTCGLHYKVLGHGMCPSLSEGRPFLNAHQKRPVACTDKDKLDVLGDF